MKRRKNPNYGLKKGDRVRVLTPIGLEHRKNRNGVVKYIDGGYYGIRPMWCKWVTELYDNEIRKL